MTKNNKILLTVIIVIVSLCLLTISVPLALWFIRKDKYQKHVETAQSVTETKAEKTYNAWVTDAAGAKTYVKKFESYYESRTGNMLIYLNDAQSTITTWNELHLKSEKYTVEVPFEIIDSVVIQPVQNGYYINGDYHVSAASAYLGDGTVVTGSPLRSFSGQSDLGDFKIESALARRIQFDHKGLTAYTAKTYGSHTLDVTLPGGASMRLDSASFRKEQYNTNGCYTGDDFTEQFEFSSEGGTTLNVSWDKIAAIIPVYEEKEDYNGRNVLKYKLATKTGSEYTGSSRYGQYGAVHAIQGLTAIGSYRLRVIIDFYGKYDKLIFQ